jgi:hypothetical protein
MYKMSRNNLENWNMYKNGNIYIYLVGGLEHFFCFHILGIIIPTDELIFFRGVEPPTRAGMNGSIP